MNAKTASCTEGLYQRFTNLAKAQGVQNSEDWWSKLDSGYSRSDRHYHDWLHIEHCLALFDELQHLAHNPTALELAIWFHDAVYESRRSDNEEKSALLAESCLRNSLHMKTVASFIMATMHKSEPGDHDTALLCDIDLSILSAESAKYNAYSRSIRMEYAWVSDEDYRKGRSAVLTSFLTRPFIYTTTQCQARWEKAARGNIERELNALASARHPQPEE